MHLVVRPGTTDDGAMLVRVLEAAYGGGYSATFDRDGPLSPNDLWWVRSEKDVDVIEIDRRPAGLLVVGRGRQWLVEEALLPGFGEFPARTQEALAQRIGAHLTALFQRGRQTTLLLRASEANVFGLSLARHLNTAFTNALLVLRYRGSRRPAVRPPDGYEIRRSTAADARTIGRLAREVIPERGRVAEIERVLGANEGRGYVALKADLLVGFAALEVRAGFGDWIVGVRDSHRRRGIGCALAQAVIAALHAREHPPFATAWALDPVAGPFLRAIGFETERVYLYLERLL